MRTIGVVQARTGSTRLPDKVLAEIGDRPLVLWTLAAMDRVAGLDGLVVAIPDDGIDDRLADLVAGHGYRVHRGPTRDVLTRCWEAVLPLEPALVVRETADNPFVDADVVGAQIRALRDRGLDYLGTAGWPLGIAAEVAAAPALAQAYAEATDPAEREHVMPFLYARPERFRVGSLAPDQPLPAGRFTVDTVEDLAFARAIAARLDGDPAVTVGRLRALLDAEPALLAINGDVRQKAWQEAQP